MKNLSKNMVDNRKKNVKRYVGGAEKMVVWARQNGSCLICQSQIKHFHHCFYGNEAKYGPDRNDPEALVGLCEPCHHELHFGTKNLGYREICKDYLTTIKSL